MIVCMREEASVDLRHTREQLLFISGECIPGACEIGLRERLAVWSGARLWRADRVDRRQFGVLWNDAHLFLSRQDSLADCLVPHIEATLIFVRPLSGHLVRRMARARRIVEEEGLVRGHGLRVFDEFERLVGDILSEVIAFLW